MQELGENQTTFMLTVYHCIAQVTSYKWKNNFYEMKGGVGMSLHE